jgi:hypothetical protein
VIAVAGLLAAGCRRAGPASVARAEEAEAVDAAVAVVVRPAIRCAECHGKAHGEWQGSGHAQAAQTPTYQAMRAQAPPSIRCEPCHAPLTGRVAVDDPVVREGVTCEVCHSVTSVDDRAGPFTMALGQNVELGPICDAKDHYFHKMGCSPLHGEARFCAGCHVLRLGSVPVLTDYDEWREGPYGDLLDCLDCHMPGTTAEVAEGSPPRAGVSHHGFRGRDGELYRRSLVGTVAVGRVVGGLSVEVRVRNVNAGHLVPGGLPGRQVVVRAIGLDAGGAEVVRAERIFERRLVDEEGRVVPFYRAVREAADNRLRPKEERVERLVLASPRAETVRLEVVRRELAPEITRAAGLPAAKETVLATASLAPGAKVDWRR